MVPNQMKEAVICMNPIRNLTGFLIGPSTRKPPLGGQRYPDAA
jgi:hypothetical protein